MNFFFNLNSLLAPMGSTITANGKAKFNQIMSPAMSESIPGTYLNNDFTLS